MAENVRPLNRVDVLLKQIAEIQEKCGHNFKLTGEMIFKKSKVADVYIVYDAQSSGSSLLSESFSVKCLKCSYQRELEIKECPKCLGHVTKGKMEIREKYFSQRYLFYEARLKQCDQCNFKMVADEWDQ